MLFDTDVVNEDANYLFNRDVSIAALEMKEIGFKNEPEWQQFFASPVLGSLSDKYGRRPVLLVSLLGAGLDYLLMAFAPSMLILFIGRVISGLTGASMTVATSYMADVSDESNRSANFGMIGAAFGFGFIVGPAIGGLLGHMGSEAPFVAAAILNLANFAFGFFVLPESLPKEMRRQIDMKKINPFASLVKVLRPSAIVVLVWVFVLIHLGGNSHPSIWTLYTQYKFQWTAVEVGMSLSFVGLVIGLAQGFLTRIVIPRFGEVSSLRGGLWFFIIGFALFGVATQGWMMYAIMAIFALSGVAGPALQSLITKGVPSNEQGELQGSLVSLMSLTSILGPLIYTDLFARFTAADAPFIFPGIPYIAAAVFCLVGYLLCAFVWKSKEA